MKAIIPVAGAGTKLRPHTYTQPKALIPLAGKTVLSIIVDQLNEAGVNEFIFIIGYLGEKIQDYVQQHYPHLKCHFVQQNDRNGTGYAIKLTKEIVDQDEVIIVLGDTIAEYNVKDFITSPHSLLAVKKVDDPRNFGVAEIDEHNFISRVVEKPTIPKSNMALVGIYKIKETGVDNEDIYVTGSHLIYNKKKHIFVKVEDFSNATICPEIKTDWFSCLITNNHSIHIGSEIFWDWEDHFIKSVN